MQTNMMVRGCNPESLNQQKNMIKKNKSMKKTIFGGRSRKLQSFGLVAPSAKHVELVGEFTHWQQEPISLLRSNDGIWRTAVNLESGSHEYRFLVDDQWRDDPKCAQHVPNPYGGQNDVLLVA